MSRIFWRVEQLCNGGLCHMTVQGSQTQENLQNPPLLTSIGNVGGIQPIRMEETFHPYEDEFGLIGHIWLIF